MFPPRISSSTPPWLFQRKKQKILNPLKRIPSISIRTRELNLYVNMYINRLITSIYYKYILNSHLFDSSSSSPYSSHWEFTWVIGGFFEVSMETNEANFTICFANPWDLKIHKNVATWNLDSLASAKILIKKQCLKNVWRHEALDIQTKKKHVFRVCIYINMHTYFRYLNK